MRTIAIGDIHGCLRALEALLDEIQLRPDDRVVTIGDYVDRGPDSRNVIDYLIGYRSVLGDRLITLLGNHEILMLQARESVLQRNKWFSHGGLATMSSYTTVRKHGLVLSFDVKGGPFTCPLDKSVVSVGRDESNDIVISSPKVSARHAEFRREEKGKYRLVDLESRNGTMLNGFPAKGSEVRAGDEVVFGESVAAQLMLAAVVGDADEEDGDPMGSVPQSHWDFIESCVPYYEIDTHFFVHANALPDVDLDKQPDTALFWDRFDLPTPHVSGKHMICGHTGQADGMPVTTGHGTCIDTLAYEDKGWLTALDVGSGEFWQSNQDGVIRLGKLE